MSFGTVAKRNILETVSKKQLKLSAKQADAVLALASARVMLVKYAAGKRQLSEELVENIAVELMHLCAEEVDRIQSLPPAKAFKAIVSFVNKRYQRPKWVADLVSGKAA